MYSPSKIVTWLDEDFQLLRRSRRKTLAAIVAGAMKMQGTRVLALGRAMDGRALPFLCVTVKKGEFEAETEGRQIQAEQAAPRSRQADVAAPFSGAGEPRPLRLR